MPVKIRLARRGRRKKPFYHIVVADSRSPRDGKFIEKIGIYNPLTVPAEIDVDRDRAMHWLEKGAQPTDTARAILSYAGVMYMKHLARGVRKGALTEEQAKAKIDEWLDNQREKIAARKKELADVANKTAAERKAAESKIRAAKEASQAAALASAQGAATEAGVTGEPTGDAIADAIQTNADDNEALLGIKTDEADTKEAPAAKEEKKEAPEAKEEAPAAKEEKKEEAPAAKEEAPAKEEVKEEAPKAEEKAPAKEEKKEEAPAVEEVVAAAAAPAVAKEVAEAVKEEAPAKEEKKEEKKEEAPAEEESTGPDDLRKIEGIGPKIENVLNDAGIAYFDDLASQTPEQIKAILEAAEGNFGAHDPGTWPKQAKMAADGKWDELKAWQDELDGGKE